MEEKQVNRQTFAVTSNKVFIRTFLGGFLRHCLPFPQFEKVHHFILNSISTTSNIFSANSINFTQILKAESTGFLSSPGLAHINQTDQSDALIDLKPICKLLLRSTRIDQSCGFEPLSFKLTDGTANQKRLPYLQGPIS